MSNTRKVKAASPVKSGPQLLGKGRYAIHVSPEGDGVITYRPDGDEADSHQVVPAKFWNMFMKIISGDMADINPMTLMKTLMGG